MAKLLAKNNIIPGNQYSPLDIQKAIKSELNKNPSIRCVTGKETGEIYLKEIYICFNKQLELVDCEGSKNNDNIITNCFTKLISYPSVVSDNTGSNFIYYLSIVVVVVILAILAIVKLSTHLKRNGWSTNFLSDEFPWVTNQMNSVWWVKMSVSLDLLTKNEFRYNYLRQGISIAILLLILRYFSTAYLFIIIQLIKCFKNTKKNFHSNFSSLERPIEKCYSMSITRFHINFLRIFLSHFRIILCYIAKQT